MKTLFEKIKKENLEKIEKNKIQYESSAKKCLKLLHQKHFWFELQIDDAMLILSMTTDKILDVENLTELFEKS